VTHTYVVDRADVVRGVLLGAWVLACDIVLKGVARAAACGEELGLDDTLPAVFEVPVSCRAVDLAGPAIQIRPQAVEGAWAGLGTGFSGFSGQMYALGLLLCATILTILVRRWQWHADGDPRALGILWGAAVAAALPRLLGDGRGVAELSIAELSFGMADFGLAFALVWLAARFVAELRA
jgi:hypothetical protein